MLDHVGNLDANELNVSQQLTRKKLMQTNVIVQAAAIKLAAHAIKTLRLLGTGF